jgi:hypothetical protein
VDLAGQSRGGRDSGGIHARELHDFGKADTDKDGSLTFEEIEAYSRTIGR